MTTKLLRRDLFIHQKRVFKKNTIKILDQNEELVIRSLNQKKLDNLNLKRSDLLPHLKQLLSGKKLDSETKDEVTKKIYDINEHYYWQFKYEKYNPSFDDEDKEERNVQDMAIILENNNIVKDLLSNTETFLRQKKSNQKGRNNSEKIINSTKKHIEDELYLDKTINYDSNNLKKAMEIFEQEKNIYHFLEFTNNYFCYLNISPMNKIYNMIIDSIIECFYKEYSIYNTFRIIINDKKFAEYITLEAEKYIQIKIHNSKDLECFIFKDFKSYLYIKFSDYLDYLLNNHTIDDKLNIQYQKK